MRVIITGGTGMIGSELAASLAGDGHEVIALSRNPSKHAPPPGVQIEKWDSKTAAGWGHLADGADAIVNLAAESIAGEGFPPDRWTAAKKRRIRQSRIDAGNAVVEAVKAAASKPAVVIQASGNDYYGDQGDEVLTEEAPPGDSFLADITLDWEGATAPVAEMGVRHVVTRSGMVLSPEGGALPSTILPFRLFVGGPLGGGRQWWSWIHIQDQVRAIRFLIENEAASGPVIVCTPNPLRNKDFARVIGEVMGRPSYFPVPAFALKLALGEVADTVLHSRRTLPEKLQALGFTFLYPDLKPALEDLLK
jgi:hypothetical protein